MHVFEKKIGGANVKKGIDKREEKNWKEPLFTHNHPKILRFKKSAASQSRVARSDGAGGELWESSRLEGGLGKSRGDVLACSFFLPILGRVEVSK